MNPDHPLARPWIGFLFVFGMVLMSALSLPYLPETVPLRYSLDGEPRGWGSRWLLLLSLPLYGLVLCGVLALVRSLIKRPSGRGAMGIAANLLGAFFAVLHGAILGASLGLPVDVMAVTTASVGVFFGTFGALAPRIEPNPWIGIRTPSTLRDPEVWRRVHERARPVGLLAGAVLVVAAWYLPPPWQLAATIGIPIVLCVDLLLAARREGKRSATP